MTIEFSQGKVYLPNSVFGFDTTMNTPDGDQPAVGLILPRYIKTTNPTEVLDKLKEVAGAYVNGSLPEEFVPLQAMFDQIPEQFEIEIELDSPPLVILNIRDKVKEAMEEVSKGEGNFWPQIIQDIESSYSEPAKESVETLYAKVHNDSLKDIPQEQEAYDGLASAGHVFHVYLPMKDGYLPDKSIVDTLVADGSRESDSISTCPAYDPDHDRDDMGTVVNYLYEMLPDASSIKELPNISEALLNEEIMSMMEWITQDKIDEIITSAVDKEQGGTDLVH